MAARKVVELTDRYNLGPEVHVKPAAPPPPRARRAPPAGFDGWVGGAIFSDQPSYGWSFDTDTGRASPNVKIHRYRDRFNWKIEVMP